MLAAATPTPGNSMHNITVQSSDGDLFEVSLDFVQCSGVFTNMVEELGGGDEVEGEDPVTLPTVDSTVLKKILEWVTLHKDGSVKAAEIRSFFCKDQCMLVDLIRAADFLDMKGLLDEACRQMAIDIQFSYTTADQIRKAYGYEEAENAEQGGEGGEAAGCCGDVPFDTLPLNVKLDIFARVGESSELLLLETLPAVSAAWRELARHPGAWRDVDAWHLSDTRVLRHAPALRDVELTLSADLLAPRTSPRLEALRASQTVVQRRLTANLGEVNERGHTAVLDMVWRSRRALRFLELDLRAAMLKLTDSEQRSSLEVVAALERLEELDLSLYSRFEYNAELTGGDKLPLLTSLKLSFCYWTPWFAALLSDLLQGAQGLRVLRLGPAVNEPSSEEARTIGGHLERLAELREFRGPACIFAAAPKLPKLRKLECVFRAEHFIGGSNPARRRGRIAIPGLPPLRHSASAAAANVNVRWRHNFSQLLERMKAMPALEEVSLTFYIDELPNTVFEGVLLTLYSFKENTGRPPRWLRYSFERDLMDE